MRALPTAGALLLLLIAVAASADSLPIMRMRELLPDAQQATWGRDRMVTADFDLDGRTDVVVLELAYLGDSTEPGDGVVHYLGWNAATASHRGKAQVAVPMLPPQLPEYSTPAIALVPPQPPLAPAIVHVNRSRATLVAGWPPRVTRSFSVPPRTQRARVADLDLDGRLELLVWAYPTLYAYDLETGNARWSRPQQADLFEVMQLDGDGQPEIVVASSAGIEVFDGATRIIDWIGPYGVSDDHTATLVGAELDGDGGREFAAHSWTISDGIEFFTGSPYARLRTFYTTNFPNAFVSAELTGGAPDELVVAQQNEFFQNVIRVYATDTGAVLSERPGRMNEVRVGDFDGNGLAELASLQDDSLAFDDAYPAAPRTQIDIEWGPFVWQGPADIDADGDLDWTFTGTGGYYRTSGRTTLYGYADNARGWRTPSPPYWGRDTAMLQADGDAALEIAIAREHGIELIDGATGNTQGGFWLTDFGVLQLAVVALDGDAVPDLVALGRDPSGRPRLIGVSGATQQELWRTGIYPPATQQATFALGNVDADAADEILFVAGDNCSALDLATRQEQWSFPCDAAWMSVIERDDVRELLLGRPDGQVTFLDAATRLPLDTRDFGDDVHAVALLPGRPGQLLVAADGRLRVMEASGEVSAESEFLGSLLGFRNRMQVVPSGNGFVVRLSSSAGVYELLVPPDETPLFRDGFE